MVLTVLMLGGVLLSASAIAGFLMFYQARQANDAVNSAKAFFAADTALEWQIYCFEKGFRTQTAGCDPNQQPGVLTAIPVSFLNRASASASYLLDAVRREITYRSQGVSGRAVRALETVFAL